MTGAVAYWLVQFSVFDLACAAGVRRGGKGERRAHEAQEDHFILTSLPLYGLPGRLRLTRNRAVRGLRPESLLYTLTFLSPIGTAEFNASNKKYQTVFIHDINRRYYM